LNVEEAIKETVGNGMVTLLVFGLAEAVYYEGEEVNGPIFNMLFPVCRSSSNHPSGIKPSKKGIIESLM